MSSANEPVINGGITEVNMLVIYRNGVPTVVTGWRAWLIMLVGALAFVVIGGLMLGLALTVWTVMLVASRSLCSSE